VEKAPTSLTTRAVKTLAFTIGREKASPDWALF